MSEPSSRSLESPSKRMYEFVLDQLDDGVHVVDRAGQTIWYNAKMAELESMSRQDVLGRSIEDVFSFPVDDSSTLLAVLKTGRPVDSKRQTYFNSKGKAITTLNHTRPILYDGQMLGAVEIAKDVTQVERILQASILNPWGARFTFQDIVGNHAALTEVIAQATLAARTHSSILIIGETGTGKELFAQSIHHASPRAKRPFVTQNCAALPEALAEGLLFGTSKGAFTGATDRPGLVESAQGGTLLLDELNALSPALQAKLLRVIQEKTVRRVGDTRDRAVDVRILATMNEEPLDAIQTNRLRKDLYYRLSVVTLAIPPLRDRKEDIPLLIDSFVQKYNRMFQMNVHGVSASVAGLFSTWDWPGNVRELEHVIEGAMNILGDELVITERHLPWHMRRKMDPPGITDLRADRAPERNRSAGHLRESMAHVERDLIQNALVRNGGNVSAAARELGMSRQSLQYRLRKH